MSNRLRCVFKIFFMFNGVVWVLRRPLWYSEVFSASYGSLRQFFGVSSHHQQLFSDILPTLVLYSEIQPALVFCSEIRSNLVCWLLIIVIWQTLVFCGGFWPIVVFKQDSTCLGVLRWDSIGLGVFRWDLTTRCNFQRVFDRRWNFSKFSCYFYIYQSLYCMLGAVPTWGGVLEYVFFLCVFCLLVSSKLDLYVPAWEEVL